MEAVLTRTRFNNRKKQSVSSSKATHEELVMKALQSPMTALRGLVKNNLFKFLQYLWSEYSQDEFRPNWHIKYICDELEIMARRVAAGQPKLYDLIINVPPGSTKTAIVSIMFPLWCWVNWFHLRFITASYTQPLSLESAEYSRDVMRSEKFKSLFPELEIKQDKDTKSNFRIVKLEQAHAGKSAREHKGGNRFSTSVGGTVTGFHGHLLIVDDPIDPMRAISDIEVRKANHWMDNTLPFRKVDKSITPTIVIMQRLHQNDPTGHLLTRAKQKPDVKIKHICIPGEIKNYRDKVSPPELLKNYSKDGLLDPIRLPWSALKTFSNLGNFTYGGQIGQNPVPLGGGMFKVENFQILMKLPAPADITTTVRYWDKAGTEGGDGAFTVGAKMCKTKDGKFIVCDIKRGRWSSEKREEIIRRTAEADGQSVKVYVEQEPGSGGKESAQSTIKNLAGYSVYADRPTGDKALRADPYSVQVNEGNVQLLHGIWNTDYIDELENFPNSTFKDQTDASSGAFAKLAQRRKVRIGSR